MAVDPKWICNIRGKDFVMVGGLLDSGHKSGLIGIETDVLESLCKPAEDYWVVRAIGRFRSAENGEAIWSAVGDASPATSQMKGAYLRHAETRAVARMLRFATNCAMTAAEELGGEEDAPARVPAIAAPPPAANGQAAAKAAPAGVGSCDVCHGAVSKNDATMSQHKFQRTLCRTHRQALEQKQAV
jgi:hypothetical protein